MLDLSDANELDPFPATLDDVHRAQSEAYTRAVRQYSDNPPSGPPGRRPTGA